MYCGSLYSWLLSSPSLSLRPGSGCGYPDQSAGWLLLSSEVILVWLLLCLPLLSARPSRSLTGDYEWTLSAVAWPDCGSPNWKNDQTNTQSLSRPRLSFSKSLNSYKAYLISASCCGCSHFSLTDFNCARLGGAEALCEVVSPERGDCK